MALFYINWKEHGSPVLEEGADVEAVLKHGAYEFLENGDIVANEESHFYLPSQDEWIKAAYYTSNTFGGWYSLYPTQHNNAPGNNNGDVTNQANYDSRSWFSSSPLTLTPVNYFSGSESYYGCCDMGGNVNEWTYSFGKFPHQAIVRGGCYESQYNYTESNDLMISAIPCSFNMNAESSTIGFRIAERGETTLQKNIPIDLINKVKGNGAGWSSAEIYDAYVAAKNIYYCSLPKKIIKSYEYGFGGKLKEYHFQMSKDHLLMKTGGIPRIERHWGRSNEEILRVIYSNSNYKVSAKESFFEEDGKKIHYTEIEAPEAWKLLQESKLMAGTLEIPKQLIIGGITGLVVGAASEVTGKYLGEGIGEGIGYLCGGSQEAARGAVLGEIAGEDIGTILGMILPFIIFV